MIYYCPNCWSVVKEDEKICQKCNADIEPLDQKSYFEKLVYALSHSERTTRLRAAYILGEQRNRRAIKPFAEVVNNPRGTGDIFLVETIAVALGKIDGGEVIPILIRLMDHPSFLVKRAALTSLIKFKNDGALKVIKRALKDPSPNVRELAREILRMK